jgi:hypothetical protein
MHGNAKKRRLKSNSSKEDIYLLASSRLSPRLTDQNDSLSIGLSSRFRISMCLSLTSRMGKGGHRSVCILAAAGLECTDCITGFRRP